MRKILAYTSVAVLLGVAMMLAPFALFAGELYAQDGMPDVFTTEESKSRAFTPDFYMQEAPSLTEQAYGITPATFPADFLFIAFMVALGLVAALGVMRYLKEKRFSNI